MLMPSQYLSNFQKNLLTKLQSSLIKMEHHPEVSTEFTEEHQLVASKDIHQLSSDSEEEPEPFQQSGVDEAGMVLASGIRSVIEEDAHPKKKNKKSTPRKQLNPAKRPASPLLSSNNKAVGGDAISQILNGEDLPNNKKAKGGATTGKRKRHPKVTLAEERREKALTLFTAYYDHALLHPESSKKDGGINLPVNLI
jgi:hypothetical protein